MRQARHAREHGCAASPHRLHHCCSAGLKLSAQSKQQACAKFAGNKIRISAPQFRHPRATLRGGWMPAGTRTRGLWSRRSLRCGRALVFVFACACVRQTTTAPAAFAFVGSAALVRVPSLAACVPSAGWPCHAHCVAHCLLAVTHTELVGWELTAESSLVTSRCSSIAIA